MPINLEMPKLSDTMTEGTVVRWLKKEGDQIEIGDEVAEIETDKATMAMEAFDEGILAKILIPEGGKAPIGSVLAIITAEGESLDAAEATPAPAAAEPAAAPAASPSPSASSPAPAAAAPAAPAATPPTAGERIKSSPLARKIAADQGVDLAGVTGSGPGGRIVKADVVAASQAGTAAPATGKPASPAPAPAAIAPTMGAGDQRVELSSMRRIIAERLLTSKTTIPHFYLHLEVDAAPLMAIRKQVNAQAEVTHGNKYTVNDFILKSVINALQAVPAANASFNGDHIVQFEQIGIAVAVAIDDGLVTPVVKNAAAKSLLQISKEVKDLAARARDKKLKPDEFDGGTITVSNLGAYGIESFDAIINPPQAAILSVGAIMEKPVVVEGQLTIGLRMNLGLSCDHRVVDGAVGAQLLGQIKKLLENPALMLV